MPKFPKGFGRRKSSINGLEDAIYAPVEHSFKVFERPGTGSNSFDGGAKLGQRASGPLPRKPLSHLDDNIFEKVGSNRGSGASNTNTVSTADNSSRLSAASTAASSAEMQGREDWRSPHDKPFNDIPVPPAPKGTSSFSLKTAGRTLSWGRNKPMPPSPPKTSPSPPALPSDEEKHNGRSRAVTASSYASTATPPKLEDNNLGLSLGGDFADMFSGFGKRKSVVMDAEKNRAMSQSPDTIPSGPTSRSSTANRLNIPSALNIDRNKEVEASPYSWSSQHSRDGLMASASPPPFAPRNETPPPPPQHRAYIESPASMTTRQRPGGLANTGLRRTSGVMEPRRQSTLEYGDAVDEDARLLRESMSASRQLNDPGNRARDSWLVPSTSSYKLDESSLSSWRAPSTESTPRAKKPEANIEEDNLFEAAHVASRYQMNSRSSPAPRNVPAQNKVMTPAQFERYKQDQERLKSVGGKLKDEEEDDDDETYDDEEDEAEKAKQAAKQRRKQEANMAVYRQQMMKVTGETPDVSLRPGVSSSQSSPNLGPSGRSSEDVEEEDEEVPLAILQAHGFPSKGKPPMRSMGSNPNLRAGGSISGGVVGSGGNGGNLPVFARNLPQDPYFGASVVNPMHRESLAFGGGGGSSMNGSQTRGLPPGGLVGVIATEERSRAMRRGSPNMQGEYGPSAPPGMNGMGMQMPPGMANMYPGMGGMPMGPANPMMLTPGDQAQIQMNQQMQQFMQMQMQFMQMMAAGQGAQSQNGQMPMGPMGDMPRPGSAHQLRSTPPQHQRAMTMLEPNSVPWQKNRPGSSYAPSVHGQGNGYAPSIAPSERSNVGLPGRYRPVSHVPVNNENQGRLSTMSGALQNWETKNASATIKPVKKSGNASDEDDEEGWEEMAKKKREKKSIWRSKKDSNNGSLRDTLNFAF